VRIRPVDAAGSVALIAGAPGPVEFAQVAAEEAPEAEAFVGDPDRTVGIAFTGGDRVAHTGDQHVAHRDFRHDPVRRAVGQHDVHGRGGRLTVGDAQPDLLVAGH
jgi:hypothetical protein